jgi:hypothetical protein
MDPQKFFRRLRHGMKSAARTTTTAFGNVASEITGRYVYFFTVKGYSSISVAQI